MRPVLISMISILSACMAAPMAGAQEAVIPLPMCEATEMVAAERRGYLLSADDWHGYDVDFPAPGWAFYSYSPFDESQPDYTVIRLENCAGQSLLTATVRRANAQDDVYYPRLNAVTAAIRDRVSSDNATVYTLDQIAEAATAAGAEVTNGNRSYQSCACDALVEALQ
jgi:hypothetical protein